MLTVYVYIQFHENVSRKCSNNVIKYGKSWNICRHGDIINQLIIWIKITNTIVINWTLYCLPLFPKRRIAKIYFSLRRGKEFPTIPCSSPEFTKFSNKLLADFARTDTWLVFYNRKLLRTDNFFTRIAKPICNFPNPDSQIYSTSYFKSLISWLQKTLIMVYVITLIKTFRLLSRSTNMAELIANGKSLII